MTAGALGCLQAIEERREAAFQLRLPQLQRVIMHHERAEGRHRLDHAGDGGFLEPVRQGEHEPAQVWSTRSPNSTTSAVSPPGRKRGCGLEGMGSTIGITSDRQARGGVVGSCHR